MSKDDDREGQTPDSDGLDALASELEAPESDDADEELDLASLAAVVGARAVSSAGEPPAPAEAEKVVLSAAQEEAAPAHDPAPAPAVAPPPAAAAFQPAAPAAPATPAAARPWLVPTLLVLAIGLGGLGFVLGRTSSRTDDTAARAPAPPVLSDSAAAPNAATPVAVATEPVAAPPAEPTAAPAEPAAAAAPAPATAEPAPQLSAANTNTQRTAARAAGAPAAASPAPIAREAGQPSEVAAAVAEPPVEKPAEPPATLAKTEPASRSVDDLLDEALAPGKGRPAAAQAPAELPDAPSRDEVTQAMAVLLPAIRGCAMGQTGLATAGIVVRSDGRVASVELSGAPFEGTASGRCMEGVLRRARFARFRQPTFRVRFPFAIQ